MCQLAQGLCFLTSGLLGIKKTRVFNSNCRLIGKRSYNLGSFFGEITFFFAINCQHTDHSVLDD